MKRLLFITLIHVVMFARRQWCRVAGHRWKPAGYGAQPHWKRYVPVNQCQRCREWDWKAAGGQGAIIVPL